MLIKSHQRMQLITFNHIQCYFQCKHVQSMNFRPHPSRSRFLWVPVCAVLCPWAPKFETWHRDTSRYIEHHQASGEMPQTVWACSLCTLENPPAEDSCDACGHPRPAAGSGSSTKLKKGAGGTAEETPHPKRGYVCIYIYTHIYIYIYNHIIYIYIYMCIYMFMYICTYIYIYIYTIVCIYIYIHCIFLIAACLLFRSISVFGPFGRHTETLHGADTPLCRYSYAKTLENADTPLCCYADALFFLDNKRFDIIV